MLMKQNGFQGFRGQLQDARRMAHELCFVRLGNITMPVPDRDIPIGTKVCQALELIIDEGF